MLSLSKHEAAADDRITGYCQITDRLASSRQGLAQAPTYSSQRAIGVAVVRHDASKSRIVCSAISPASWKPSTIS